MNLYIYDIIIKYIHIILSTIVEPLANIYNHSFFKSKAISIYKSSNFNNYRPIFLIIQFSKILETFVFSRLLSFCDFNSTIISSQFGFRKGLSILMDLEIFTKLLFIL